MCPGCALAATAWGVMWCAGRAISWRSQRRQQAAMDAVEANSPIPDDSSPDHLPKPSAPRLVDDHRSTRRDQWCADRSPTTKHPSNSQFVANPDLRR